MKPTRKSKIQETDRFVLEEDVLIRKYGNEFLLFKINTRNYYMLNDISTNILKDILKKKNVNELIEMCIKKSNTKRGIVQNGVYALINQLLEGKVIKKGHHA